MIDNYNYHTELDSEQDSKLRRIRWQCRRGMLELDYLLNKFIDQHYLNLSNQQQHHLELLLTCSDQDLYNWFMQKGDLPSDPQLTKLIQLIINL